MADYEQAVFISYAWGGEREDIVNEIDETLQQRGIRIVRDKRALGYRGSIREFMERIGRGSCIIVVISDKYLRSPNCMFELVEIADNKQFHDRIFPVVLSDANIYDPLKRIEYIKFWEGKRKELAKAMKTLDPANLHGIREEMDDYDRIRDKISGLTSILKDMNTLTPDMHRDSEFSNLYDAIIERLQESTEDSAAGSDRVAAQKAEEARAEAERKAKEEADRIARAEANRLAARKAEEERLASVKAEEERKAKEEADQLAAQKAEEERVALAKAEADRIAAQKAEAERLAAQRVEEQRLAQAKAEADRLAGKKAVDERLAQQKAEEERLAKAKADREAQAEADRKAKEEADRLAAQKAEAERLAQQKAEEERKAQEKVIPVAAKVAPVSVAPAQKKPASKGLMYGIGAVILLAVVGIGFSVLNSWNKNSSVSTPTNQAAVVAPATEALIEPTLTDQPTLSPSVSRPTIDGLANETEWVEATVYDHPHGKSYFQNDDDYLYILIDLIRDTVVDDADYNISFYFDGNENKVVDDTKKDLMYGLSQEGVLSFVYLLDIGCSFTPGEERSNSEAGESFGPSFNSTIPHHIWEFAFALDEIQATPGQRVRFGIEIVSGSPYFRDILPESFSYDSCDFSKLVEIDLGTTDTTPPTSATTLVIGSTMTSEKDGMTLLYIPAGEFTMGSNDGKSDEQPVHKVYLDAFWIDKTEVTNKMYALCVVAGFCQEPTNKLSATHASYYGNSDFDNYPVINVDWNMAMAYCEWAGRRLPTEAEWEKAARGENTFTYPWGNSVTNNNLLNYNSAVRDTTEVGKYSDGASPYGALDMAGNVDEWVNDWYDVYPGGDPSANSDFGQTYRVLRGGSFSSSVRSAFRGRLVPSDTYYTWGFRCSRSP